MTILNENNLISLNERTTSEQREIATKGGIASGEARRERRELKRALETLLENEIEVDGEKLSGAEAIALKQFKKALDGDTKAFEVVRDTAGQKPVDKTMNVDIDPEIMAEVERIVDETMSEELTT